MEKILLKITASQQGDFKTSQKKDTAEIKESRR